MSVISWLEGAETSVAAFVKKEIAAIEGEAPVVEAALENAATIANNAVNRLKNWVTSPQGQGIEAVITAIPGIGPYVTDVLNFLPQLVIDLGWAKAEFTKSPAQIVQDGITTAVNAPNSDIKATNLAVLQAHINTKISALSQAPISIQGALSMAPTVYDGITPATAQEEVTS